MLPAIQANEIIAAIVFARMISLELSVHLDPYHKIHVTKPATSFGCDQAIRLGFNGLQAAAQDINSSAWKMALLGNYLTPMAPAGLAVEEAKHVAGHF